MNSLTAEHLERVRSQTLDAFSMAKMAEWISSKTTLEGRPFSFVDHEYQERLAREESREIVVKKPSQIGITEYAIRWTLGVMDILPDIHVIYTLPTAKFADKVVKSRMNPIIEGSSYLRSQNNRVIDSASMKQIGHSFLYIQGTIGMSAAISVPASVLVHDEVDFSDQDVLSSYQSRLTHSRYKIKFKLSTPTLGGYGIDKEFINSRRHFNQCKCHHCGTWFLPDYFRDVKIPGWSRDLREISQDNLHVVRYHEAVLLCPACGKQPSLQIGHRNWVLENSNEAHVAAGFSISPFDAPNVIALPDLIEASTKYARYTDFINFNLGQCAEDSENRLSLEELETCWVKGEIPKFTSYVCGIDVGLTSYMQVAGILPDGRIMIVAMDRLPLSDFHRKLGQQRSKTPISNGVIDSQPYVDLVSTVQAGHPHMYAAVYRDLVTSELFHTLDKEENPERLQTYLKLVAINRNKAFDQLMAEMRRGNVLIHEPSCGPLKEVWMKHMQDMKRIQKPDKNSEMRFVWEKTKQGQDHFHHSLLYTWTAAQMRGFVNPSSPIGLGFSVFRHTAGA